MLHYSYVVTNNGTVTLTGVTLVDDQEPVTCVPPVPVASLAPGATITCSATHEVTQADLDAGSVVNVATGDSDQTPEVTDTVSVPGAQTPGLLVEKSAGEPSFAAVGEVIHYSYVVTNTGNVTLTGVTLVDDQEPVTCDPAVPVGVAGAGCDDHLLGDPRGDAGGPRCGVGGERGDRGFRADPRSHRHR